MDVSTVLQATDYRLTKGQDVLLGVFDTINPFIKWEKVSTGERSLEDLKPKTIFIPSDGILSHFSISLTDSLLEERKNELKLENRKFNPCND